MEYKIGQTFIDEYQPEAAVWCARNRAYITKEGNKRMSGMFFDFKRCGNLVP